MNKVIKLQQAKQQITQKSTMYIMQTKKVKKIIGLL